MIGRMFMLIAMTVIAILFMGFVVYDLTQKPPQPEIITPPENIFGKRIDTVERDLKEVKTQIEALQKSYSDLKMELDSVHVTTRSAVNDLDARVKNLTTQGGEFDKEMDILKIRMHSADKKMSAPSNVTLNVTQPIPVEVRFGQPKPLFPPAPKVDPLPSETQKVPRGKK